MAACAALLDPSFAEKVGKASLKLAAREGVSAEFEELFRAELAVVPEKEADESGVASELQDGLGRHWEVVQWHGFLDSFAASTSQVLIVAQNRRRFRPTYKHFLQAQQTSMTLPMSEKNSET